MKIVRRRVACLLMVGLGVLLAGCSPDDIPGVKLSERGRPVLVNCGTWFWGVQAFDADSGRLIWSAQRSGEARHGVGEVEIGVTPADWIEVAPLDLDAVPLEWRFEVTRGSTDTFFVDNAELAVDQVFIFRNETKVSPSHFRGKTCGYDPPIPPAVTRAVFFGICAICVVIAIGAAVRGRHRMSA